jgi:acyl phosphate:glycerol-3-phosphate acyltransferase
MNAIVGGVSIAAAGYLVGSIPIAGIVARRRGGPDLREVGDRNPGFWNAKDHFDRRSASLVFAGDVAKGAIAAGLGVALGSGDWWLGYLGGFAAMVGHAWPVFARFRGGRSVLTFVGAAAVLSPITAAVCVALLVAVATVRGFAWGARAGVFAFPLVQLLVDGPDRTAATGCLMTVIGLRFALAARARPPSTERPESAGDQR